MKVRSGDFVNPRVNIPKGTDARMARTVLLTSSSRSSSTATGLIRTSSLAKIWIGKGALRRTCTSILSSLMLLVQMNDRKGYPARVGNRDP
jgi:hypothetical protein